MNHPAMDGEHMVKSLPPHEAARPAAQGPTCCPAGLDQPMTRAAATDLARLFKAIAVPARLQILALIRCSENEELCACDFTDSLGLSQPTISHHLKVLTDSGLLIREQRGTWAHFRIDAQRLAQLASVFDPSDRDLEVPA
jgi:ArsR family transcriptional regulator